jgi:SAM-dependent methyltransferase
MRSIGSANHSAFSAEVFQDPINSHSRIAGVYRFRAPYVEPFFSGLLKKMGLGAASVALDLCCGRGELAVGFAPSIREVYAVDGSSEMLDLAIPHDKVRYNQADVNQPGLTLPGRVDAILIGRAIHWVGEAGLRTLTERYLAPGGVLMVSSAYFAMAEQPWYLPMQFYVKRFGYEYLNPDLLGVEKLAQLGYAQSDRVDVVKTCSFSMDYLLGHQLSSAYGAYQRNVMQDIDGFSKGLRAVVSPYLMDGKLTAKVVNWGVVFKKKSADLLDSDVPENAGTQSNQSTGYPSSRV